MQEVNISELKAHLSAKIQRVKMGEKMIIMDRNTPVAFLTPYKEIKKTIEDLIAIPATKHNHEELAKMVISKTRKKVDLLKSLREDRDAR